MSSQDFPKDLKIYKEEECIICLSRALTVLFEPCGHLLTCESCHIKVDKCHVCRKFISRRWKQQKDGFEQIGVTRYQRVAISSEQRLPSVAIGYGAAIPPEERQLSIAIGNGMGFSSLSDAIAIGYRAGI